MYTFLRTYLSLGIFCVLFLLLRYTSGITTALHHPLIYSFLSTTYIATGISVAYHTGGSMPQRTYIFVQILTIVSSSLFGFFATASIYPIASLILVIIAGRSSMLFAGSLYIRHNDACAEVRQPAFRQRGKHILSYGGIYIGISIMSHLVGYGTTGGILMLYLSSLLTIGICTYTVGIDSGKKNNNHHTNNDDDAQESNTIYTSTGRRIPLFFTAFVYSVSFTRTIYTLLSLLLSVILALVWRTIDITDTYISQKTQRRLGLGWLTSIVFLSGLSIYIIIILFLGQSLYPSTWILVIIIARILIVLLHHRFFPRYIFFISTGWTLVGSICTLLLLGYQTPSSSTQIDTDRLIPFVREIVSFFTDLRDEPDNDQNEQEELLRYILGDGTVIEQTATTITIDRPTPSPQDPSLAIDSFMPHSTGNDTDIITYYASSQTVHIAIPATQTKAHFSLQPLATKISNGSALQPNDFELYDLLRGTSYTLEISHITFSQKNNTIMNIDMTLSYTEE